MRGSLEDAMMGVPPDWRKLGGQARPAEPRERASTCGGWIERMSD